MMGSSSPSIPKAPPARRRTYSGSRRARHASRSAYEAHAPGRLTVVPVGLSFEARKRFRGRVLVSFGEPVDVSSHLAGYRAEPAKALHTLTTAIQGAMEREVVHVERIDTTALARAVEAIDRGELERELWGERGLSGQPIDPCHFPGSVAAAVERLRTREPGARRAALAADAELSRRTGGPPAP